MTRSRGGTYMGNSAEGLDGRQVHTKGMIGGGWRVEGIGGPEYCTLTVWPSPGPRGGKPTTIVVDRNGHVAEVSR